MFFIPLGLEDSRVGRLPWVSIVLAVLMIAVWLVSSFGPSSALAEARADKQAEELVGYWKQHRYLDMPEDCARFFGRAPKTQPPAWDVSDEQDHFDAMCASLRKSIGKHSFHKYGFVPSRGVAQIGVFTHMFLHGGLFHLLFNLLFFYICGPFIEDIWGRWFFLAFFVLGGVFAGLAQALMDTSSTIPIIGASGAIAACMGAFSFRFATRRIQMLFVFMLIIRKVFFMPAWLWGGLWFAGEVLSYWANGLSTGVAVMAHIGGFVFGFAIAVALKVTGIEAKHLAPAVEKASTLTYDEHPALAGARQAFAEGRFAKARDDYKKVLDADPNHTEALWGLTRATAAMSDDVNAANALERYLRQCFAHKDNESVIEAVATLKHQLDLSRLRPATALQVARVVEAHDAEAAEVLYAASAASGAAGARALLRAAQLALENRRTQRAIEYAERAAQLRDVPPDVVAEARAFLARARDQASDVAALGSGLELGTPMPRVATPMARTATPMARAATPLAVPLGRAPTPAVVGPVDVVTTALANAPIVVPCKITGRTFAGYSVEMLAGGGGELAYNDVVLVGVGLVDDERALLIDVLLRPRPDGSVFILRFHSQRMGLGALFASGTDPKVAFQSFTADLVEKSRAQPWPARSAVIDGEWARYPTTTAFEAAFIAATPVALARATLPRSPTSSGTVGGV